MGCLCRNRAVSVQLVTDNFGMGPTPGRQLLQCGKQAEDLAALRRLRRELVEEPAGLAGSAVPVTGTGEGARQTESGFQETAVGLHGGLQFPNRRGCLPLLQ